MSIWTNAAGNVIVNASGAPIDCATCPCGTAVCVTTWGATCTGNVWVVGASTQTVMLTTDTSYPAAANQDRWEDYDPTHKTWRHVSTLIAGVCPAAGTAPAAPIGSCGTTPAPCTCPVGLSTAYVVDVPAQNNGVGQQFQTRCNAFSISVPIYSSCYWNGNTTTYVGAYSTDWGVHWIDSSVNVSIGLSNSSPPNCFWTVRVSIQMTSTENSKYTGDSPVGTYSDGSVVR